MITYTVIEKQVNDQGQQSILQQSYMDENQALSDMFSRLSYAAIGTLPYHSVHLIIFDGTNVYIKAGMAFDRSSESDSMEE